MSALTVFYQECPVCGRNLRIAVKFYGRPMSCAHCEGEFIAGKDHDRPNSLEKAAVAQSLSSIVSPAALAES